MVNIVVEGPDNSGKSTLVGYLSQMLRMPVVEGQGPPKSVDEINNRVVSYSQYKNVIFDRHPAISNPIYDVFRGNKPAIRQDILQEFFHNQNNILVFCRGDRTLDSHVIKPGETAEHIAMVENNHRAICDLYDAWALHHADVLYNKGQTRMSSVAKMLLTRINVGTNFMEDILEFHTRFDLVHQGPVRHLEGELGDFRENFMQEELDEYKRSRELVAFLKEKDGIEPGEYRWQLEQQLDALVDLVYVALGTAHMQGFNFAEAWRRVHEANMKKIRATNSGESKRGTTFDVIKPPNWQPPRHADLVEINDL